MSHDDVHSQYIINNQSHNFSFKWFVVFTFIGIFCGWLGGIIIFILVPDKGKENPLRLMLNNFYNNGARFLHVNNTFPLKKKQIITLQPIITNFDSSPKNWIRLDLSLMCNDIPDEFFVETLHQDIMAYVRSLSINQITGPQGFQYFKEDIKELVKLRSNGFISNIILRTFIVA
ncbi:flagellar basal body-associated FliL family protein [Candidatus Liberibacter brunswickensis]|uniref:flagellar basal body-associated FliL family protein n=1 Tax=Candidatus Liberibacter brunswickensis TaxID=1968796 RepID=UPI002FE188D9